MSSEDILFVLTINNSEYKENCTTLVGKIIILKNYVEIDLNSLSSVLNYMGITRLNIFCLDGVIGIDKVIVKEPAEILLIELSVEEFEKFLKDPKEDFMTYNKNSLYILRNGDYRDVKLLFNKISTHNIDIGRGGGQKSHMISPLDFRLSSYLMAMFNFKYNDICHLNTFDFIHKKRYLPFFSRKK